MVSAKTPAISPFVLDFVFNELNPTKNDTCIAYDVVIVGIEDQNLIVGYVSIKSVFGLSSGFEVRKCVR